MSENRSCALYLGVHIAERVLSHVFENVKRMPSRNPGYDFICGRGYKIDVKSSCRRSFKGGRIYWGFQTKKNQVADYFLCLAFDNRDNLNPEHLWLIPAKDVIERAAISIYEDALYDWSPHEISNKRVQTCCNMMK